jgi:hypothetical protein
MEAHLARTLSGLVARIAQRRLALTLASISPFYSAAHYAPSAPMTDDESTSSL